jgi:hypothetical protein
MDFPAFINHLAKETRFDRNLLQQAYEREIKTQAAYTGYKEDFQFIWDKWIGEGGNSENISEFFVANGEQLFRELLTSLFPFNRDRKQIYIVFKEGGTPEDIIIHFFYRFSKKELEALNKAFSFYKIREVSQRAALTRLFLEAFLMLHPIISGVVGFQYSMMVDESKFLEKERGRILFLELVARPSE